MEKAKGCDYCICYEKLCVCIYSLHSYSPQAVLHVMRQRNVSLNIQTYGCLALGCDRQEEGLQLLKDMQVTLNNLTLHTIHTQLF